MCKVIKISFTFLFVLEICISSSAVANYTKISDDEILTSTEIANSTENLLDATTFDDASVMLTPNHKYVEFPFWINNSVLEDTTANETETEKVVETTRTWIPVKLWNTNKTTLSLNETKYNETQIKMGEKITEGPSRKCSHYKRVQEFELDKMVDVWQTIYYQLPEKVHCFKIFVKKLLDEDKEHNKNTYGNFSGKVDWSRCHLEIKSASKLDRKHFLQGNNNDGGVMNNVIIEECHSQEKCDEPNALKEEVPDQWFVVKNLLLMRDCDTGGILVFSRVPFQPSHEDIVEAANAFGEDIKNGRMACEDNEINNRSFDDDHETEAVTVF